MNIINVHVNFYTLLKVPLPDFTASMAFCTNGDIVERDNSPARNIACWLTDVATDSIARAMYTANGALYEDMS